MRGLQTYLTVRKMAKNGLNTEEIFNKIDIPKRTIERYLRHKPGRQPTIPVGICIKLPNKGICLSCGHKVGSKAPRTDLIAYDYCPCHCHKGYEKINNNQTGLLEVEKVKSE